MSDLYVHAAFALFLPPGQKFMLIALAHAASDDGTCQISQLRLERQGDAA